MTTTTHKTLGGPRRT
ncbi:hypothetical protein, partial [Streptomyces sp. NPDC047869]